MRGNKVFGYKFGLSITAAVVLGAAVLGGCSSGGGSADYSAPMPSGSTKPAKKPAVGPAITEKLSFEQIALDSPVKKIDKNGVPYLGFKYTDVQGNVRTCEIPKARTTGELLPEQWVTTFNTYKKDDAVVMKKREVKRTEQGIVDFPFVSPKPVAVESGKNQNRNSQRLAPPSSGSNVNRDSSAIPVRRSGPSSPSLPRP